MHVGYALELVVFIGEIGLNMSVEGRWSFGVDVTWIVFMLHLNKVTMKSQLLKECMPSHIWDRCYTWQPY